MRERERELLALQIDCLKRRMKIQIDSDRLRINELLEYVLVRRKGCGVCHRGIK